MKNGILLLTSMICIALVGCTSSSTNSPETSQNKAVTPVDSLATQATRNILDRLDKRERLLIGHQDDLSYGHSWNEEPGRSDVLETSGLYPDVCGWELAGIELSEDANIDGVLFSNMRKHMQEIHQMGGINTMTWHSYNIITGNDCWDVSLTGIAASVLPDGPKHEQYLKWLDKFADFVLSIKDDNGNLIPLMFRPYHELTGSWFWWGKDLCSPDEYKQLWRMTYNYLTKEKNVHNLLYVYSTGNFNDTTLFLERYPGDDVVDILGFDIYQYGEDLNIAQQEFLKQLNLQCELLSPLAKQKNKPWAVCEAGLESIPLNNWFTELGKVLIPTDARYILFWRNAHDRESHFYAPFKGHASEDDFKTFVQETRNQGQL
ncbi:MAG: glycoside hydrolase family 26 protein [Bacteroidales bacterium]|nr:glycoside hydrolase family 26 protein [Bacteroidales bacterium]